MSPYAACIKTGLSTPDIHSLATTLAELCREADFTLVESAGGLLVPIDRNHTMADLALAIRLPLLVAASDSLGVLSHALALAECAAQRGLNIAAFVLVQRQPVKQDLGPGSNYRILSERLPSPVVGFPHCPDDDDLLAAAAESSGLLKVLGF